MMRASGTGRDGRRFIMLGVSRGNIERLVDRRMPIDIDAAELGFDGRIVIIFGETEDDLARLIAPGFPMEDRR